jgi:hypothetical protein
MDGIVKAVHIGDYDTVNTDSTKANLGFFNICQIQTNQNPDVCGFELS